MHHLPWPTRSEEEWGKDHRDWVLGVLLPMVRPPGDLARLIQMAYESGAEQDSDGSTIIADRTYPFGNIKDPVGVMHDWIFKLHHQGSPDPDGHYWGLLEANWAYARGQWAFERKWRAVAAFLGLSLLSWVPWHFGSSGLKKRLDKTPKSK